MFVVDAREKRLVSNETMFRDVNERIEEIAASHGGLQDEHVYELKCECSTLDCNGLSCSGRAIDQR